MHRDGSSVSKRKWNEKTKIIIIKCNSLGNPWYFFFLLLLSTVVWRRPKLCAIPKIVVFLIIFFEKIEWNSSISYTQPENTVPTARTPLWYGYNNQSSRLNKGGVHSVTHTKMTQYANELLLFCAATNNVPPIRWNEINLFFFLSKTRNSVEMHTGHCEEKRCWMWQN